MEESEEAELEVAEKEGPLALLSPPGSPARRQVHFAISVLAGAGGHADQSGTRGGQCRVCWVWAANQRTWALSCCIRVIGPGLANSGFFSDEEE